MEAKNQSGDNTPKDYTTTIAVALEAEKATDRKSPGTDGGEQTLVPAPAKIDEQTVAKRKSSDDDASANDGVKKPKCNDVDQSTLDWIKVAATGRRNAATDIASLTTWTSLESSWVIID